MSWNNLLGISEVQCSILLDQPLVSTQTLLIVVCGSHRRNSLKEQNQTRCYELELLTNEPVDHVTQLSLNCPHSLLHRSHFLKTEDCMVLVFVDSAFQGLNEPDELYEKPSLLREQVNLTVL